MFKALVKKSRENKGFSLIELIVVIAIIAILALILVPRFGGFTGEAKAAADNATIKTIETAIVALYADGTLTDLNCDITINNYDADANPGAITCSNLDDIGEGFSADDFANAVKELIGTKYKAEGGTGFTVEVRNGNVKCKVKP